MRTKLFIPVISLLCISYALANPNPGDVPFDFSFTEAGGPIPEIDFDQVDAMRGMDISIATTAKTDEEARALLECFSFPFRN